MCVSVGIMFLYFLNVCCYRDVLGTVCITSPFSRSQLSPLLSSETVDRLELDCLNSVRVRDTHTFTHMDIHTLMREQMQSS